MDIALITYHYSCNNGAVMQTYALCRYLQELGHNVKIIDIRQDESNRNSPLYVRVLKPIIFKIKYNIIKRNLYPEFTRRYFSLEELRKDPPAADCYIVGSDQVWNPNISKDLALAYFLDFGPDSIRRISYASSIGLSDWPIEDRKVNAVIKTRLHSFYAISVRESEGQKICQTQFGVNPEVVLDPTFLNLSYPELIRNIKQRNEIVCYKLNKTKDFWDNIQFVGEKLNKPIALLNHNLPKKGYKYCVYPSLRQWMERIARASFIITDSFHGVAFSIINRKNFVAILNHNNKDSRLVNLMRTVKLEKRVYDSVSALRDDLSWMAPIDYDKIEPIINNEVEKSRSFLYNALK